MTEKYIAVDIGMTNIDMVVEDDSGIRYKMMENNQNDPSKQVSEALKLIKDDLVPGMTIGVTGGRYRQLPEAVDGYPLQKVDEMHALGMGGLAMTNLDSGLVVSAGTGSAMVAASRLWVQHVTGSAVGGGTLLGLSSFILNTNDFNEVDELALQGDAGAVDIMLREAVGGEVGRLPENANAVNMGQLQHKVGFSRQDLAAGLVRLVSQVIAVIAINAADAMFLKDIIMLGHLMDLESVRKEVRLVGEFYDREFSIPDNPGYGTAIGVLEILKKS